MEAGSSFYPTTCRPPRASPVRPRLSVRTRDLVEPDRRRRVLVFAFRERRGGRASPAPCHLVPDPDDLCGAALLWETQRTSRTTPKPNRVAPVYPDAT